MQTLARGAMRYQHTRDQESLHGHKQADAVDTDEGERGRERRVDDGETETAPRHAAERPHRPDGLQCYPAKAQPSRPGMQPLKNR